MTDAWKLEFDGWDPDAIRVGCGEELRELRPGDTVRFRAVCRAHRGEASGAVRDGSLGPGRIAGGSPKLDGPVDHAAGVGRRTGRRLPCHVIGRAGQELCVPVHESPTGSRTSSPGS